MLARLKLVAVRLWRAVRGGRVPATRRKQIPEGEAWKYRQGPVGGGGPEGPFSR